MNVYDGPAAHDLSFWQIRRSGYCVIDAGDSTAMISTHRTFSIIVLATLISACNGRAFGTAASVSLDPTVTEVKAAKVAAVPPAPPEEQAPANQRSVSLEADAEPSLAILGARCQPCHFPGGKMYERLPFDRAETIETLGDRLFTRIKDPEERKVIQTFLDARENMCQPQRRVSS